MIRARTFLLVAAWLAGCGSGLPEALRTAPARDDVGTATRVLWATLPSAGDHDQVFVLEPGPGPGELTAVSATAVFSLDREGRITRRIPLSGGQHHFPVGGIAPDGMGPERFLGVLKAKKHLALYDGEGLLIQTIPCGPYARFAVGDVLPSSGREILVEMERGQGLEIYSRNGARLKTIPAQGYLTAFQVARQPGSSRDQIVTYTYPHEDRSGIFHILSGDGATLAEWRIGAISDFGVLYGETDEPQLLYPRDDRLVLSSLRGQELSALNAPGADSFKRFSAQPLSGGLVVLGSGSGYRPYHGLWFYDRMRRLRAMAAHEGHAYSLLVDAEDSSILVGGEGAIWRYSAAGVVDIP